MVILIVTVSLQHRTECCCASLNFDLTILTHVWNKWPFESCYMAYVMKQMLQWTHN